MCTIRSSNSAASLSLSLSFRVCLCECICEWHTNIVAHSTSPCIFLVGNTCWKNAWRVQQILCVCIHIERACVSRTLCDEYGGGGTLLHIYIYDGTSRQQGEVEMSDSYVFICQAYQLSPTESDPSQHPRDARSRRRFTHASRRESVDESGLADIGESEDGSTDRARTETLRSSVSCSNDVDNDQEQMETTRTWWWFCGP